MPDASNPTGAPPAEAVPGHNNPPPPFAVVLAEKHADLSVRANKLHGEFNALPAIIETPEQHEAAVAFTAAVNALLADITAAHTEEKAPLAEKTRAIDVFFLTRGLQGAMDPLKRTIASRNGAYQDRLAQARQAELDAAAESARKESAAKLAEAADLEAAGRHTEAAVKIEVAQAQDQHADAMVARANGPVTSLGRTHSAAGSSSLIVGAKLLVDADAIDLEKLRPFMALDALETAVRQMIKVKGLKPQQLLDGALGLKGASFERTTSAR